MDYVLIISTWPCTGTNVINLNFFCTSTTKRDLINLNNICFKAGYVGLSKNTSYIVNKLDEVF